MGTGVLKNAAGREVSRVELWRTVPEGSQEAFPGTGCPRCGSSRVHRSRARSGWARLLRAVSPLRPFRCSGCRWRGYRVPTISDGPEFALPPVQVPARKHRSRPGSKPVSAATLARRRRLVQTAFALTLAVLVGLSAAMCHAR